MAATPSSKIEQRARALYDRLVLYRGYSPPFENLPEAQKFDWRRVARLTFRYEKKAAKTYAFSGVDEIDAAYKGLT